MCFLLQGPKEVRCEYFKKMCVLIYFIFTKSNYFQINHKETSEIYNKCNILTLQKKKKEKQTNKKPITDIFTHRDSNHDKF